jgi:palmitoyltransferase
MRPIGRSWPRALFYWIGRLVAPPLFIYSTYSLTYFFWRRVTRHGALPFIGIPHGATFVIVTVLMFVPGTMMAISMMYAALIDPGRTFWVLEHLSPPLSPQFLAALPSCEVCGLPKPPRAHHCRICGYCHLRMDHHCPMIGRCVAVRNYQAFVVLLHWTSVASFAGLLIGFSAYRTAQSSRMRPRLLALTALMMVATGVSGGLLVDSLLRLRRNCTTLEAIARDRQFETARYDLGARENMRQLLGDRWYRCWWPMVPDVTGFEWAGDEFRRLEQAVV